MGAILTIGAAIAALNSCENTPVQWIKKIKATDLTVMKSYLSVSWYSTHQNLHRQS